MREHMGLFRGKRLDNGEWVEGNLVHITLSPIQDWWEITTGRYDAMGHMVSHKIDPDTVGECTGLRDKNGKLIFEGDIVHHHNDNPYVIQDEGKVYWDKNYCGWRRTSNGAFHHGVVDTYRMSRNCVYEIIGNCR